MRAFIFPGQGSQSVGMGKALSEASPVAREVFQEVDDALGQRLFRIMTDGPEDQLTLTENAQPAIMANAMSTARNRVRFILESFHCASSTKQRTPETCCGLHLLLGS